MTTLGERLAEAYLEAAPLPPHMRLPIGELALPAAEIEVIGIDDTGEYSMSRAHTATVEYGETAGNAFESMLEAYDPEAMEEALEYSKNHSGVNKTIEGSAFAMVMWPEGGEPSAPRAIEVVPQVHFNFARLIRRLSGTPLSVSLLFHGVRQNGQSQVLDNMHVLVGVKPKAEPRPPDEAAHDAVKGHIQGLYNRQRRLYTIIKAIQEEGVTHKS